MLSKKYYKEIAEIIKYSRECGFDYPKFIAELAIYFKNDNPKFDRNKFVEACEKE